MAYSGTSGSEEVERGRPLGLTDQPASQTWQAPGETRLKKQSGWCLRLTPGLHKHAFPEPPSPSSKTGTTHCIQQTGRSGTRRPRLVLLAGLLLCLLITHSDICSATLSRPIPGMVTGILGSMRNDKIGRYSKAHKSKPMVPVGLPLCCMYVASMI